MAVSARLAADDGLTLGDTRHRRRRPAPSRCASSPSTARPTRPARSIFTLDEHRRRFEGGFETVLVSAAPGVSAAAARGAVLDAASAYPDLDVGDQATYVERLTSEVNGLLALVGGMLALAIAIALLGIANTLGLSVVERVRESPCCARSDYPDAAARHARGRGGPDRHPRRRARAGLGLVFARVAVAAGRDLT